MDTKSIENRIRQHYVADSGEWLVEKGKVKEAKLLKEACETIERLRKDYKTSEYAYYSKLTEFNKRERAVKEREKAVAENEERLRNRIEQTKDSLDFMMESLGENTND
ncbi:hypothetical protein N9949_02135 [Akkermansiaceae bacterium]|nr:hypothetical protein [Akkermansiaceae bacterium]